MNTTDHRDKIEALVKAGEQRLVHFRLLLATTRKRLYAAPDDPILLSQTEELEDNITSAELKIAILRSTLQETAPERDEDQP